MSADIWLSNKKHILLPVFFYLFLLPVFKKFLHEVYILLFYAPVISSPVFNLFVKNYTLRLLVFLISVIGSFFFSYWQLRWTLSRLLLILTNSNYLNIWLVDVTKLCILFNKLWSQSPLFIAFYCFIRSCNNVTCWKPSKSVTFLYYFLEGSCFLWFTILLFSSMKIVVYLLHVYYNSF